jgi:glycosyltransferase involved in cell wall biosynthesis
MAPPAAADFRRKVSFAAGLPGYSRVIAREVRRADAVHVPLPGDLPFLAMLIAQVWRKPLLARYGSSWTVNGQTTVMNRVTKLWMRMTAGGRNVMIATGDDGQPPSPGMHWLFSTALTARELQQLRPNLDRGVSRPPRLVYAGRLSSEKGVAVLIEAMARLSASGMGPLPILRLAGDGPERPLLEQQARALLPPGSATFLGQLDRAALSTCLAWADAAVQPSLSESLCKAWLDAMAHGLPVVASDVGAASTVIGEDGTRGVRVPAGDAGALATALQRLLTEPRDWPALRRRCRAYAESRTLDVWAERVASLCAAGWGVSVENGKLREGV